MKREILTLHRIVALWVVALCVLASSCSAPETDHPPLVANPAQELAVLFEEIWQEQIDRSASLRMREGLAISRLDDLSFTAFQAHVQKVRSWLERLDGIRREDLDHSAWINRQALRWDLAMTVESERWFWHGMVLTPYSSPLPGVAQLLESRPLGTESEREEFLDLLGKVPRFVRQLQDRARGQAERGIFVWRPNFEAAKDLLRAHLSGNGDPFSTKLASLEGVGAEQRARFLEQVRSVVHDQIDPELEELIAYLEADYAQKTYQGVGAAELPEGDEYYRYAVRAYTTMNSSPEEIHQRGLALVEQMETEMDAIRAQIGFDGSRTEFHRHLRTDPTYFPQSPEEVSQRLLAAAESMESVVETFFGERPEAAYGVERLDPALEGTQTYGYYDPPNPERRRGLYYYNGSKLNERSWLNLRAVSLHELVPGHHFHIARQIENQELFPYRRNSWHGAYTEGWGSYSSWLGKEAGVYDGDPLSEYGMYVLEIFLATRLVVDTGMSALGWSLEQARQYMQEHTLESETQIETESLRYSADWPGQALAYQMGKLALLDLRRNAEQELGERFDLRGFHEAVLELGSLPIAVLEEHIDSWIEQQRSGG